MHNPSDRDLSQDSSEDKKYIHKQSQLFDSMKDEFLKLYEGKYILFEDGEVLDVGDDRLTLAMKAYQNGGMRPLFIEKVSITPDPPSFVYTPFLISVN